MEIEEFIKKWNVAFESKEQETEFAIDMRLDIEEIIQSLSKELEQKEQEIKELKRMLGISESLSDSYVKNLDEHHLENTELKASLDKLQSEYVTLKGENERLKIIEKTQLGIMVEQNNFQDNLINNVVKILNPEYENEEYTFGNFRDALEQLLNKQ